MTLGERIKALRMGRGMSQEGLADALDVTRQAVSKWETDGSVPDIDKLIGLCGLFGVSMDYLVRGKEHRAEDTMDANETQAEEPAKDSAGKALTPKQILRKICGALCMIHGIRYLQVFLLYLYSMIKADAVYDTGGGFWVWLACPLCMIIGFTLFFWEKRRQIGQKIRQIPHKLLWAAWFVLWIGALVWYIEWEDEIDIGIQYLRYQGQHPEILYRQYLDALRIVYPGTAVLVLAAVCLMVRTLYTFRKTVWGDTKKTRGICCGALAAGILGFLALGIVFFLCTPGHDLSDWTLFLGLFAGFWLGIAGITVFLVTYPARRRKKDPEPADG